jgi:hypothetical protein
VGIGDVLETLGSLVAALKAYAAKAPAVVSRSVAPAGFKPSEESVAAFEQAVARFRRQCGGVLRWMPALLIESLEAFEAGKMLGAVQPLLQVLDHLERMQRDKELAVGPADVKRLHDYRIALNRILPGNQPELEGAGRGLSDR